MINLHDDFLSHPKLKLALAMGGLDAMHLWFGMQMHAHQRLTDGFIPELVALEVVDGPKSKKARQKAIEALVGCRVEEGKHGLLEVVPGGYHLHNYLRYAKSKERVLAERERQPTRRLRRAVIARDGRTCGICHRPILAHEQLELDHVLPSSKGGRTVLENLQPTHGSCNRAKGNRCDA